MQTESIGQILLRDTELTSEQLDLALRLQQTRRPQPELGRILIEKGFITSNQLSVALARQWDLPYLDTISAGRFKVDLIRGLPLEFFKKHCILPVVDQQGRVHIALADPLNVEAYDAVLNRLGRYCPRLVCPASEIEQAVSRCYYQNFNRNNANSHTGDDKAQTKLSRNKNIMAQSPQEDLLDIAQSKNAPVIKMVNTILFQAVN
ncbi:MAG: hypothetical protein KAJ46_05250, partial [Sedimentisphaerales bacterium]|nr:hypothetical protein [Sedimentisphaerales bacterium]